MKFTNKVYDTLKWVAQIVIPAIGTFLFALSTIFGWGIGDKIVGVLTALDVMLGSILAVSSNKYYKEETPTEEESDEAKNASTEKPRNKVDKTVDKK